MKPKKNEVELVTVWKCPSCTDQHEDEDDAKECCFEWEGEEKYKCLECEEYHDYKEDAETCCELLK